MAIRPLLMGAILSGFLATTLAARACGTSATTYSWKIGDARFDGADPTNPNSTATFAASITPGNTLFECVASWPEPWQGYYQGGSSLVWGDCIWTGNGPDSDKTVSFALDWRNRTMWLTHTFNCSDQQGTDSLATGSVGLDMNCTSATTSNPQTCIPNAVKTITTHQLPVRTNTTSSCVDARARYQSWALTKWTRQYKMDPGTLSIVASSDTGPSFTLSNSASMDVFACTNSGQGANGTFTGSCSGGTGSTAWFSFDVGTEMLTVTQRWSCENVSSYDAVGVAYVQAGCQRTGNVYDCSTGPVWIGTSSL